MSHDEAPRTGSYWTSKQGIALCVFLAIAAVFLFLEHRAHALEWLPYALLLACPLLHLFMHGGHSHGGRDAAPHGRGEHERRDAE